MTEINFRSDTHTLPTAAMRDAMHAAPLGDDTFGEDPTVKRLEELAAAKVGKEAAMLVISGVMGNLTAMMTHARPGDEVIVDREAHLFQYESGGLAAVAGLMPAVVDSVRGCMDPAAVRAVIRPIDHHFAQSRLLCLENSHNVSGGRVVPLELFRELCHLAHAHDLAVHLDGARIFNAAIAAGVPVTAYTQHVDSLMFCFSKGLSAPLGSVVCGTRAFIERARFARKRVGGGMRQAGVFAAAGIVALEQMIDRLADDHANARLLAEALIDLPGARLDLDSVETNMVNIDLAGTGLDYRALEARLKAHGVLALARTNGIVRFVVTRHHDRETILDAIERIRAAFP